MYLTPEEQIRYSRHLSLPDVGMEGQLKLKQARVLCIGAGGLGSPALLYLAAAGIGTIGIVDPDVVELSNLQRQVLYTDADIGQQKAVIAEKHLLALNPGIEVAAHVEEFNFDNALSILGQYDMVIDAADNFETRYLVNDAAFHLKKPDISASIFQHEGQCSVFTAADGPCYRCLFPSPPPSQLIPSCAAGGVFGAMCGLLGTIQAMEAIKIILNKGRSLIGRLLTVNGLTLEFREFNLERNPDCILCQHQQSFSNLPRYSEKSCMQAKVVEEITAKEVAALQEQGADFLLLDVREQAEYDSANLGGKLIPLGQLPSRLNELNPEQFIVVHCRSGGRSRRAVELLQEVGFSKVKNMKGGILAWQAEADAGEVSEVQ